MTKEELEKEAIKYAEKINLQNVNISGVVRNHISQAYLAGVEPREKRIAELKAQIEKMKLCQNCKYEFKDYMEIPCRNCIRCLGDIKRKGNSDKWEIKGK